MKAVKKMLSQYSRILLLLLIVAVLAMLKPEAFWNWGNITTVIFQQAPFTMLMSFGMTLAIITKGIDKSMGSILVLSNVIAATIVKNNQIFLGITTALLIGIICGVCNGLLITKAGIPPL
ncbi:ABC transporter permease [Clostridium sp. AM58-1XD]|uniref:ABC transporter permease subunit n=1 Tax=Clostridium sp. AM58-1XD TaxID=2292307 RepID=UPI000E4A222F|nr:ABC transporter permease [Clostridium sp. AM58-1XD]RGY98868.1 ABC transporter permease [Clostridium sp. AM58-1XD]